MFQISFNKIGQNHSVRFFEICNCKKNPEIWVFTKFHILILDEDKPDEELTDEEKQQKALDAAIKNIMERFACIVITQPLHVVTIRAMASFVGSEEEYNGILHGLVTTVKENG